jgi:hypothetical protein
VHCVAHAGDKANNNDREIKIENKCDNNSRKKLSC